MADPHADYKPGLDSPASKHSAVTPSDSTDLATRARGLFVGAAGDVVVRDEAGTDATYVCQAGQILPIRAVRVLSTGTTASSIIALHD